MSSSPHAAETRVSGSGNLLLSCSYDFSIRLYKFDGEDWVTHQHIAYDSRWNCVDCGRALRHQRRGGVRNGKWQKAARCMVAWNNVNGLIAVGGGDESIAQYTGHEGDVNCVSWHLKDSTLLATASDDGSIRLLRLQL
ncbi:hypothetical protein PRIPAC_91600 [Pristionchus pacificus]|uniref:WD40 domain-containing protein n=1 Tax=Pristionchus pacificus TaxID=54126 RepID=A0A2A6BIK0_PRIPA|nr:hypothetical protein PRIPAC_91600 [Pristionchus pacificus]|eukprot:PDM65719.1 WD40 domain-containing protein [Pristionchus pacificus]